MVRSSEAHLSIVGKIACVSCKNFVTYDAVTFYPGEYLNVILGPNGTGKSTLVAAIVLGLGGSEKLLSRVSGLGNYVKNGKESAWISVKIYKDVAKHTINFERLFQLQGKSVFKVNGSVVKEADFLSTVRKYNIQVSNLCQFLPQDRVQDFAKMNPQELFASTIDSVCDKSTIEHFAKLKDTRKTFLGSEDKLNEERKKLDEVEKMLPEYEAKIQQLQSRNRCLKELDICRSKMVWLECNVLKEKVEQVEKELDQAKQFLERDTKSYNDVKKKMDSSRITIEDFQKKAQKEKDEAAINSQQIELLSTEFEQLDSTIRLEKIDLSEKIAEHSHKEEDLRQNVFLLGANIQELKEFITKYSSEDQIQKKNEELSQQMERINSEIRRLWERHRALSRQLEDNFEEELGNIKRKIHSIENVAERKLKMLQLKFEHVYNAVVWIRRNRNLFQSQIYEPMLLEMTVKDASHAIYFENSVRLADLLAFTCVDKQDFNLLVAKLMNEQGLEINVIHSDEASHCNYRAKKPISSYARYGFQSFLIDMVEGPAPVLNYLCREYHIHEVLIGHNKANEHADDVPEEVFLFFTPEYKYSISYSKYSGNKSLMREHISPRNLLCTNINKRELIELKQRMKDITDQSDVIKNERSVVERKINELEVQKKDVVELKRTNELSRAKIRKYKDDINLQKRKIENMKRAHIDIEQEEKAFKEAASRLVQQCLQNRQKSVQCLQQYEKCVENYEYRDGKLQIYKQLFSDMESEERSLRDSFQRSQKLVDSITATLNKCVKNHKDKVIEIRDLCEGNMPDSRDFPYRRKFKQLPNDIPSLKDHIEEIQSKLNCLEGGSDKIVEKYEALREKMDTLKTSIENLTKEKTDVQSTISKMHEEWYIKISEVVKQISSNFTRLMNLMEYAGEVQLISNDQYDYNAYGIKILVQYRNNTKLQVLDRFVQSGGERAVAIGVYSLSLQHLTHVPFRCVDEINQGMDPRNETKIFELLVDETCKEGQPQYFFISPKLLPNLKYNDFMNVNIVFNGKFIDSSVKFC